MTPVLSTSVRRSICVLLFAAAFVALEAVAQVGTIQFVAGDVRIRDARGVERVAGKGGPIHEGDAILTGGGVSSAQLKMSDNAIIAIRPESQLKIDQYAFKGKEDGSERALMSLVKGGFRTVTGLIGRANRGNYRVSTATATIGIRGTDYEPYFVTQGGASGKPAAAAPVQLAQAAVPVEFAVDVPERPIVLAQGAPGPGGGAAFSPGDNVIRVNVGAVGATSTITRRTLFIPQGNIGLVDNLGQTRLNPPGAEQIFRAAPPPPAKPAPSKPGDKPAADKPAAVAEKPAADPPMRERAVVDAAPPPPPPVTETVTVTATATVATAPAAPSADTSTQPISGTTTSGTGLTLDLTQQVISTQTGQAVPISQGAFAVQAQAAADAALLAVNTLNTLITSVGTQVAGISVSSAVSNASPAVASAQGLTINSASASSNAASSASAAVGAQTLTTNAVNAFNANVVNGVSFSDSTAVTARNALDTANFALQNANTSIQNTHLATVNSSVIALTAAQQAANAALSAANNLLATLTAAGLQNSTASVQLSAAQGAAQLAQSEAVSALNAQNAGNFSGAQQHALNAEMHAAAAAAALGAAAQIVSGVASAHSASALASNAQSAASTGATAVNAIASDLATVVNPNATIVATNAPITAFNNPAVLSLNFGHVASSQAPEGSSTVRSFMGVYTPKPNTQYVLDGNRHLVEMRSTTFEGPGPTDNINDANVKFSGGTALDHYQAPDNTVYMGRIQGGQVAVTDNTNVRAPFTRNLGPTSVHWLVGLTPGNAAAPFPATLNNVQTVIGTHSYSLTAATRPTDRFGNVGTLNSASVTANFSAQTASAGLDLSFSAADPVNISARNLRITASTPSLPIEREGVADVLFFESGFNNTSVNCTGANCAPSGYVGEIGGTFGGTPAGAVGTGMGLGYGFVPVPATTVNDGPDADFIHGVAVLNTPTAPVTGVVNTFPNNANVRHTAGYSASQVGSSNSYSAVARNTINLTNPSASTLAGPVSNANYLFDASGNLVRIFDTPYVIFDRGTNIASTSQFPVPTPLARAQVSFGGGTSSPAERFLDPTGTRFGRWAGGGSGLINVTDLTTGMAYLDPIGSRSAHWAVYSPPSTPLTGAFHYTRLGDAAGNPSFATLPTDSYGNVGTLERARLTANFSTMKVSAGLRITMPSVLGAQNLGGSFFDAPISSGGFNVSSNPADNPANTDNFRISCFGMGCASLGYGGRIQGSFTGAGAEGAFFRYTFNTLYDATNPPPVNRVANDYIDGLVAFGRGPAIVAPPTTHPGGPSEVLAAYTFLEGTSIRTATPAFSVENPANLTLEAGNLRSVSEPAHPGEHPDSLTLTGGTASPSSPLSGGNGITLGWWSGSPALTLTGEDWNGCFGGTCATSARTALADGLSWVRGPAVFPWYLPGAIARISNAAGIVVSGTANFALINSIARDQSGVVAGPVTASLFADFNKQAVGFDMAISTPAGNWAAYNTGTTPGPTGTIVANVRMDDGGGFHAFTGSETTTPVAGIDTHRQMTVTLNGNVGFGNVQGRLMGPGVNGAGMSYVFSSGGSRVLGALAFNNPAPFSTTTPYHLVAVASGQFDGEENTPIYGGFVSHSRTQSLDGRPVRVDMEFPVMATPTGCTGCQASSTQIPAIYAIAGATAAGTGLNSISIGTAQTFDPGYEPATGLRWGRWGGPGSAEGAVIGVTDRISGVTLPSVAVGPNTQGAHFIRTGVQSGPTVLPLSGTFNYTMVGHTRPTDNSGNIGTLNSASLTANFTAQTVSSAVNLSVANSTWAASASNVPIQGGLFFEAVRNPNGSGNLAVTRDGSNLGTAGRLVGAFSGETGGGAAVLYSLNQGGNTATPSAATVSGVVGFKR